MFNKKALLTVIQVCCLVLFYVIALSSGSSSSTIANKTKGGAPGVETGAGMPQAGGVIMNP